LITLAAIAAAIDFRLILFAIRHADDTSAITLAIIFFAERCHISSAS